MLALWSKWDAELATPLWGTWKKKGGPTTTEKPDQQ
jgi:hypothetical protein